MSDSLAHRLKLALAGPPAITQRSLAKACGVSAPSVNDWLSGKTRSMEGTNLLAAARHLHVNPNWLANGTGPMRGPSTQEPSYVAEELPAYSRASFESNVQPVETKPVPLISWVQAGVWSDIVENVPTGDPDDWIQCPVRHGPRTYALIIEGESMRNPGGEHSFKPGDRIFVDPDREAMHRSLVIARLDDEKQATFKQLLIEGDQKYLQALNPNWPNRIFPINGNCTLCGVVIAKVETLV